jgi:hypothetical protein
MSADIALEASNEEILLYFRIDGEGLDAQTFGNALLTFDELYRAINSIAKPSFESVGSYGVGNDRDQPINQPDIAMLPDVCQHRAGCAMDGDVQCGAASLDQCGFGLRDRADKGASDRFQFVHFRHARLCASAFDVVN